MEAGPGGGGGGSSFETTDNLVKLLDENVRGAREALAEVNEATFGQPWSLKMGRHTGVTEPPSRPALLRSRCS